MCLSFCIKRDNKGVISTDKSNALKTKAIASEICLSHIDPKYVHVGEFQKILRKGKVALTIAVTNEWQKRGASPVKRIKIRTRNTENGSLKESW